MVRLKVNTGIQISTDDVSFNSNMVRLKGLQHCRFVCCRCRFNSNMVRLKAVQIPAEIFSDTLFQFQYGAIKSNVEKIKMFLLSTVSIPIWCD